MINREIIYEAVAADRFDPLAGETLAIEQKLSRLQITLDGRIQGVRPLPSKIAGKPPNAAVKKVAGIPLLIAPEGREGIVVLDVV